MSGDISNQNNTLLNVGTGGDNIIDEAIDSPVASSSQTVAATGTETLLMPVSKIALGRPNQSDGPVHDRNPMPITASSIEAKLDRIIELLEKSAETTERVHNMFGAL